MSDAPRQMQRRPNRLNREHAGQSLDPTLTRRGLLAHPGSLFWAFAALVFFGYVFNVGGLQVWLDSFFGGLDSSVKSHNNQVADFVITALPYLGVGIGAIILFFVLMAMSKGARNVSKRRKLSSREEVTLHEFVDKAAQHGISKKVAREAYHQLLPHYDHQMRVTLSDRMTTTLHMKAVEVSELYGNLLRRTDRMRKVGDDGSRLDTVLDLIKAVEESTVRSLTQSKLHLRRKDPNAPVVKRPSVGQRIKETVMRSMIRTAAPKAVPKDASFVRPARLPQKEMEIKPKSETQGSS